MILLYLNTYKRYPFFFILSSILLNRGFWLRFIFFAGPGRGRFFFLTYIEY